jgi:hypothetical protein
MLEEPCCGNADREILWCRTDASLGKKITCRGQRAGKISFWIVAKVLYPIWLIRKKI